VGVSRKRLCLRWRGVIQAPRAIFAQVYHRPSIFFIPSRALPPLSRPVPQCTTACGRLLLLSAYPVHAPLAVVLCHCAFRLSTDLACQLAGSMILRLGYWLDPHKKSESVCVESASEVGEREGNLFANNSSSRRRMGNHPLAFYFAQLGITGCHINP